MSLTPRQREAVWWSVIKDLPPAEAGQKMGLRSHIGVNQTVAVAMRKLVKAHVIKISPEA